MQRILNLKSLEGKTIATVSDTAVNCIEIKTTDGVSYLLEAENFLPSHGLLTIGLYSDEESMKQNYVYVVVHEQQSKSQMAVQACHAALASGQSFRWDEHPSIVLMSVKTQEDLLKLNQKAIHSGIGTELFFETDFGAHYSGFATEPISGDRRKVFSNTKLLRFDSQC